MTSRPLTTNAAPSSSMPGRDTALRRDVDIVVALIGLVVLSPLLLLLAAAVRLTSRGPAIYRQQRVGRHGKPFHIWKLRTMVSDGDPAGPLVSGPADPRATRVGRWLRATRLDELPQLVNLLRGDLTLIGSRPEVPRFLPNYTSEEWRLLSARPGILGPGALLFVGSQAGELDSASDPEAFYIAHHLHPKLALDLDYLDHRTLHRDLALLLRTVGVLARRSRT